ncbi:hypothetical protein [Mycoplasma capricolum]|nr:hypothetical protein [Mycoplasma capricolum]UVO25105.1 hypothetical protein zly1402F_01875 [Mycoplasma capricolum subsp. capripneumoniae]
MKNKKAVITIFSILNFTLKNYQSILKDLEYKKAGVYYKKRFMTNSIN